ncbi:SDR family oxidoreductase [Labrys monachus]|uniref:SDR family oxidoreductase n=1 Tax=Labrys monachus TaxID=217067 RepID=UPI00352216D6
MPAAGPSSSIRARRPGGRSSASRFSPWATNRGYRPALSNKVTPSGASRPTDIAGPVAFLTSADARFVTGQTLVVDDGLMRLRAGRRPRAAIRSACSLRAFDPSGG